MCSAIEVGVHATAINEEQETVCMLKGDLLRAVARLCFAPKRPCLLSADDRAIFLRTIVPSQHL